MAAAVDTSGRLDVAVNNAALTPDDKPTAEFDEDYWNRLIPVDLKAPAVPEAGASSTRVSLLGRFGQPREVAPAGLWLASDQSSYVTGSVVHVEAGHISR
ncbi:SDR family oxidoreductase [Streptomyces sp. JW3]|uniref:SDR family oxidoreductase n=1 Tax=Streptomyces sp. JW3 TaxID=3456955 RepID=UPI003FA4A23A